MKTIEQLRQEIDAIDGELIKLLDRRFDISLQIGRAKKASGRQVFDRSREEEIYSKILSSANYGRQIKDIYSKIMENSKEIQKEIQD